MKNHEAHKVHKGIIWCVLHFFVFFVIFVVVMTQGFREEYRTAEQGTAE
jgi:hypothetical protein